MALAAEEEVQNAPEPISLKEFLEAIHPSVMKPIDDLWQLQNERGYERKAIVAPDIRLHCATCGGERTFRSAENAYFNLGVSVGDFALKYTCGDCNEQIKYYSLIAQLEGGNSGQLYKYGELPPFGVPVPNKVLRLFGRDSGLFLKGRQCENLGYGVAAFAYYRRVVENHKSDILNEIIKVCQTLNASKAVIDELQAAQKEISFTKAVETIKAGLPHGLLINGHNPLLALHGALSVGLHDETDETCLQAAHAVRLVLIDLVEKISLLKQDNKQLSDAVQLLLSKKA